MSERWETLDAGIEVIEGTEQLDRFAEVIDQATSPIEGTSWFPALRGDWLGHSLHPLLTDLPIGFWTSAWFLDLLGGKRSRIAGRRLVGFGVLWATPTLAAGVAEWRMLRSPASRRVASVHAIGNVAATLVYYLSWRRRCQERHAAGITWGMLGALIATITGFLGGHLSYGRQAGTGRRGRSTRRGIAPVLGEGEIRLASVP